MEARLVMSLRAAGRVHSPNDRTNPGDRSNNEIDDGAENENMSGGVMFLEQVKFEAEDAVGKGENSPSQEARGKKMRRMAKKAEDREGREQSKKRSGDDVSFHGQRLNIGHAIGDQNPRGEDQRERKAGVHPCAEGGVFEKAKPMKARKFCNDRHARWDSLKLVSA
jgi:hypothetical protein